MTHKNDSKEVSKYLMLVEFDQYTVTLETYQIQYAINILATVSDEPRRTLTKRTIQDETAHKFQVGSCVIGYSKLGRIWMIFFPSVNSA